MQMAVWMLIGIILSCVLEALTAWSKTTLTTLVRYLIYNGSKSHFITQKIHMLLRGNWGKLYRDTMIISIGAFVGAMIGVAIRCIEDFFMM